MIRKIFTTLILIFCLSSNYVLAEEKIAPAIAKGIQLYKAGNYTGCIQTIKRHLIANRGEVNQLAMYYLGMSYTKAGITDFAKLYYNEAIKINPNNTLGQYAARGIACLNGEELCYAPTETEAKDNKPIQAQSKLDKFINEPYGNGLSSDLNKELQRKKLERLRKEMNADDNLNRFEFKNFTDYAKKKSSSIISNNKIASNQPTDAEIVNALRVLDAAGLSNFVQQKAPRQETQNTAEPTVKSEYKPDVTQEEFQKQLQRDMMAAQMAQLSQPNINMLFGDNNNNNNNNNNNAMMNMLPFIMAQQAQQSRNGQQQTIPPDIMQTMMFGSMMPNFDLSSGNNR